MPRVAAGLWMLAALAVAQPALAATREPLGHQGRWITDADGRVVVLHGVNVVPSGFEDPPETPGGAGFARADAAFLADQGFNVVRLGLFYGGAEPQPGAYADPYLSNYEQVQAQIAAEGMLTLLDMHQDQYGPKYRGRGFPSWAALDDGAPNTQQGFPSGYLSNPALLRAYDNFWDNATGPGGRRLQDGFAEAWRRVAARFAAKPGVLGYDIFNEPWPGSAYPTCVSTEGCPSGGFDQTTLTAFSNRIIAAIRSADPRRLAFYEPNLQFDFGAKTGHGKAADANTGMSFHDYCLGAAPGLPHAPDPTGQCRDQGEKRVFQNAEAHSARTGAALLLTEFGDVVDPVIHERIAELADEFMVGWTVWGWFRAAGQIKKDPRKPPSADNLQQGLLDVLVRPYPQAVAGTPKRWRFNRRAREFRLAYSTARVGGGGARFPDGAITEVMVPRRQYPRGYRVEVAGADVASGVGAPLLLLRPGLGILDVEARVVPGSGVACLDRTPPRSRIDRRRSRLTRTRIAVRGRAADRGCLGSGRIQPTRGKLARVRVAVSRRAGRRCRFLRRNGRLSRRRACRRPLWLRARGTRRFRLSMRARLPRGAYRVSSRAVDARSNRERRRTRRNSVVERVAPR